MKRIITLFAFFLMLAMGCRSTYAQEVTITLRPGWNWIGYILPEEDSLTNALGSFVPADGDIIKSQSAHCTYQNGRWYGSFTTFEPGLGYMYLSQRTSPVEFSFVGTVVDIEITTSAATDITAISATCGGVVTATNEEVYLRGVCYGTDSIPSFVGNHQGGGIGVGSFTTSLANLLPNTTYFFRAYAVTQHGIFFGDVKSFTTADGVPTLTTNEVSEIGSSSALGGGNITAEGGAVVTERGLCWSTDQNPTILDSHASNGMGIGSFQVTMSELSPFTTYYVRAYAVSVAGAFYGNEVSFTTLNDGTVCPPGAIDALFSVSDSVQVFFSQGNMQYIGSAATPYWKFADHQWDCLGDGPQASESSEVDRDLFCWGTSGYDHGALCYQPWCTLNGSAGKTCYYAYGVPTYNLYDSTGMADWGYNAIVNGGNVTNTWRTPTREEWVYLLISRTTPSGVRYAFATVADVKGVIIVPDNWSASTYALNSVNQNNVSFTVNTISATEWTVLEDAGAVFLPAAGYRNGTSVSMVGSVGYYWTSSCSTDTYYHAWAIILSEDGLTGDTYNRHSGRSVRLIRPVQ